MRPQLRQVCVRRVVEGWDEDGIGKGNEGREGEGGGG